MVSNVAKTLHDHALTGQLAGQIRLGDILRIAEKLAEGVLHAAARRLCPALDAAGIDRLTGDTGSTVDVGGVHTFVLVGDPRHFTLAGAHIGCWNVLRRVDQVALD